MKRPSAVQESTKKIGKNRIKVSRMVADCPKKVEREKCVTTDHLGNTWKVRKIRIITVENESGSEQDDSSSEIEGKVALPKIDSKSRQSSNLVNSLSCHSVMDSHCHIDFILDRR